jgi:cyclase
MNRTLIVARLKPGAEHQVADIFARSDATDLPAAIGVRERSLFSFHELYVHVIDFDAEPDEAMRAAQTLPGFRAISQELQPFIAAYDPDTWASPRDAMARCFYHYRSDRADLTAADHHRADRAAPGTT